MCRLCNIWQSISTGNLVVAGQVNLTRPPVHCCSASRSIQWYVVIGYGDGTVVVELIVVLVVSEQCELTGIGSRNQHLLTVAAQRQLNTSTFSPQFFMSN